MNKKIIICPNCKEDAGPDGLDRNGVCYGCGETADMLAGDDPHGRGWTNEPDYDLGSGGIVNKCTFPGLCECGACEEEKAELNRLIDDDQRWATIERLSDVNNQILELRKNTKESTYPYDKINELRGERDDLIRKLGGKHE